MILLDVYLCDYYCMKYRKLVLLVTIIVFSAAIFVPSITNACGTTNIYSASAYPYYSPAPNTYKLTGIFRIQGFGHGNCLQNNEVSPDYGSVGIVNPDSASNGKPSIILLRASVPGQVYTTPYVPNVIWFYEYFVLDNTFVPSTYVTVEGINRPYTTLSGSNSDKSAVQALLTKYGYLTIRFNNYHNVNVLSAGASTSTPNTDPNAGVLSFVPSGTTPTQLKIKLDLSKVNTASNIFNIPYLERSSSLGAGGVPSWVAVPNSLHILTNPTVTDINLLPNTTYSYRFRQYLGNTYTPYSNIISTTTPPLKTAPSNLTATLATSNDRVQLSWTDNSVGETNWVIERATDAALTTFTTAGFIGATSTQFTDNIDTAQLLADRIAYRVRAMFSDGTYSDPSNTAYVSNCVKISGTGPKRVVFMRGLGWAWNTPTISQYQTFVNRIKNEGFGGIEPFKSYLSQFSFYIDLKMIQDNDFPSTGKDISPLDIEASDMVVARSSCSTQPASDGNPPFTANQYIFFWGRLLGNSGFAHWNRPVAYVNPPVMSNSLVPVTPIHETAHTFAGLYDEYIYRELENPHIDMWNWSQRTGWSYKNCVERPSWQYRASDNHIYGAIDQRGCSFYRDINADPRFPINYFRPGYTSMMKGNESGGEYRFNVISCGYIIATINNEPLDQQHAQQYWQNECKLMAQQGTVIMNSLPPINPKPFPKKIPNVETSSIILSQVSSSESGVPQNGVSGSTVTITGSGFTLIDNAVQFINTTTGAMFDILGIPSDGTSISFTIPTNVPLGQYTLKVGAFNSDWSDPYPFTITSSASSPIPPPNENPIPPPESITYPPHSPAPESIGPPPPPAPGASTLFSRLITYILNPIAYLLIGLAVVIFLQWAIWFVSKADDPEAREEGKKHLI